MLFSKYEWDILSRVTLWDYKNVIPQGAFRSARGSGSQMVNDYENIKSLSCDRNIT